jgi:hypothetical protein
MAYLPYSWLLQTSSGPQKTRRGWGWGVLDDLIKLGRVQWKVRLLVLMFLLFLPKFLCSSKKNMKIYKLDEY